MDREVELSTPTKYSPLQLEGQGSNPGSLTGLLCDLGQVISLPCAPVSNSNI